ncbi:MAG: DUF2723 domain-containing protein [candidate division WOR-3 bacterium]
MNERLRSWFAGENLKWTLFGLITLFVFAVYFQTTAPTVVFWDVGEFLAAAHILGVPHPPGTPLYVILCKFFDILPLPLAFIYRLINGVPAVESVLRMTFVPIAMGAFTAGLVYLIIYDTVTLWKPETPRHILHVSAAFAALMAAFGAVNWMNSIEAETYTPANFFALLAVYLTLLWYRRRGWDEWATRFLLAGTYLIVLATGIHLTAIFALPAMFVFVAIVHPRLIFGKEFIGLLGALILLAGLMEFTYQASNMSKGMVALGLALMVFYFWRADFFRDFTDVWTILFAVSGIALIYGIFANKTFAMVSGGLLSIVMMYIRGRLWKDWKGIALILIILAVSVEFWLIVRAYYLHHHPTAAWINEADPYNWQAFMDVLTRKQYEPAKMFPRRIAPVLQFKVFIKYFNWQYNTLSVVALIFLGLVGLVTQLSNDFSRKFLNRTKVVWLLGLVFILATIGFWFAFNLKDSPTQPVGGVHPTTGEPLLPTEVRDRDYFYATAHIMICLYAGIGLWELLRIAGKYLRKWWVVSAVFYPLAAFTVGWQFYKFYPECNRSRFYLAEDSAYNLLISPSTGGVMFTNGDNDTFPLWFAQEVLKIRKDIVIANLSLLNTNWYIRQVKAWGAPISFSYEDIDRLPPVIPLQCKVASVGPQGFEIDVPDTKGGLHRVYVSYERTPLLGLYGGRRDILRADLLQAQKTGEMLGLPIMTLRDFAIRDMIATSSGYKPKTFTRIPSADGAFMDVPLIYLDDPAAFAKEVFYGKAFSTNIYFAMTTTPEAWEGWENYLLMEGMAFRLVSYETGPRGGYPLENLSPDYTAYTLHDAMAPLEYLSEYSGYHKIPAERAFRYRGILDKRVPKTDRYDTNEKIVRNYAQVAFSLGSYLAQRGDLRRSADELELGKAFLDQIPSERAPGLERQKLYISLSLAEIYTKLGDYTKAEGFIKEAASIQPGPMIDMKMGDLMRAQGRLDEAARYYEKVLSSGMQDPLGFVLIADFYREKGDYAKAEELYKRVLSMGFTDTMVTNGLREVMEAQGKGPEAESLINSITEKTPLIAPGAVNPQGGR